MPQKFETGDPEWRTEADRLRDGIPVDVGSWKELCETTAQLGVTAARGPI